jgi:hypothetical protein
MNMNSTWKQHHTFKDNGAYAIALVAAALGAIAFISVAIAAPSRADVAVYQLEPIVVTASSIETFQLEPIVVTASRSEDQVAAVPVPCTTC